MTPVKFIEAVDSYFVYSTEALFTKVHEFIELFRNNNTVLGCLAVDTWQPSDTVSVGMIKRSPNMPAGVAAKATAGGETSTTEPTWPTTGTVSDGGVVWKMIPQSGMETATQAEVTTGTDTEKAVTPATAAGCYLRIWQGTTAPTDLSGRTAWLNTNTDPAALYYYNTAKSAWQSAVAYAAGAGTAANANYATESGSAGYASSAGNCDTVDGYHASGLISSAGGIVAASYGTNGYVKFTSGFILQWGICTRDSTVNLPTSFSSTNYSAALTSTTNDGSGYQNTHILNKANGSFSVNGSSWTSGNWIAAGY